MHEMSLAESILLHIEEIAPVQQFTQVRTIWLEIGQLACIEQESLRFYFDVIKQDSIAQQAKIEIIEIPGEALCQHCNHIITITAYQDACPYCSNHVLQVTGGNSMRIIELEVE